MIISPQRADQTADETAVCETGVIARQSLAERVPEGVIAYPFLLVYPKGTRYAATCRRRANVRRLRRHLAVGLPLAGNGKIPEGAVAYPFLLVLPLMGRVRGINATRCSYTLQGAVVHQFA